MKKDWLSIAELTQEFNITKRNQERLRGEKLIPYSKIGSMIFYKRETIEEWLEAHAVVKA